MLFSCWWIFYPAMSLYETLETVLNIFSYSGILKCNGHLFYENKNISTLSVWHDMINAKTLIDRERLYIFNTTQHELDNKEISWSLVSYLIQKWLFAYISYL